MIVYLASPNNQIQAAALEEMPALLSYAVYRPWLDAYHPSFSRILIDSGAYSELNSKVAIDGEAYKDWSAAWAPHADAIAGLDDISGDWRRSLKNYEQYGGFPTIHDSDPPPELLKDLIPLAYERGGWIGVGLLPPREGKEHFMRWVAGSIPEDLHLHGWACRRYTHIRRIDSTDSTNWWKDALDLRKDPNVAHLTMAELLEIIIKRYKRWNRKITADSSVQMAKG